MENRKMVLVIEDSPTQASQTRSVLEEVGLDVICAINGQMGLRLANQVLPDLIVLDINMPDVDGYEVCSTIKKNETTQDIPILMFTHLHDAEAEQRSYQAGAVEFIPKDAFSHRTLIETLRQMDFVK